MIQNRYYKIVKDNLVLILICMLAQYRVGIGGYFDYNVYDKGMTHDTPRREVSLAFLFVCQNIHTIVYNST